jgi:Ser-tRNA(Ala) deacylase AlaX
VEPKHPNLINKFLLSQSNFCVPSMVKIKARMETAQHILQHILIEDYSAKQTGMQFYDDKIRIDVKSATDLTLILKEELEEKVNNIVRRNLDIRIKTYSREKVPEGIDVSGVPSRISDIRIVSIGDFDTQPCGNNHVSNTSEIGVYKILSVKRNGRDVYSIQGTVFDVT